MNCLFCKIINKEIPAKIVYEDDIIKHEPIIGCAVCKFENLCAGSDTDWAANCQKNDFANFERRL